MRQVIVRRGRVLAAETPAPAVREGGLLVRVAASCVSAGSEFSAVADSGAPLVRKALAQPEKCRKAWRLLAEHGPLALLDKLGEQGEAKPLGYSAAGVVVGVGAGVTEFSVGDRVAVAGAGFAHHAELADVPAMLATPIPEGVDFRAASTVALGAIAMQGVRRAGLALGEFAAVVGAGLIGLLAVRLFVHAGCRVLAVDPDPARLALARALGAEAAFPADPDPAAAVMRATGGRGADAALFCAATARSGPLAATFRMLRRKGRAVILGTAMMTLERDDLYAKELDLLMSTSYGPGRYDRDYEEGGRDYPYAYVRWTEGRNMAEYLRLLATGAVDLAPLAPHVVPAADAALAYAPPAPGASRPVLTLLDFGPLPEPLLPRDTPAPAPAPAARASRPARAARPGRLGVALVGAGGFARATHLPNLARLADRYDIKWIVDRKPHRAKELADARGARAACDPAEALADPAVDLAIICTRHGDHAALALRALAAGKHVLVEKPLATTHADLDRLEAALAAPGAPLLAVGFNRRFAPFAAESRRLLAARANPCFLRLRMNAGFAPPDSWLHDDGGRIVGEACHLLDLARFLVGSPAVAAAVERLGAPGSAYGPSDNASLVVRYADGSLASVDYFACGAPGLPKERIECHADGASLVIDDWARLESYGFAVAPAAARRPGKGHGELLEALHATLRGDSPRPPIPLPELFETSRLALRAAGIEPPPRG